MGKAKAIYSELSIARESTTITCVWQTQRSTEECESLIVGTKETSEMPWRLLTWGRCGWAN